jgi:hypothetical protein
MLLVLVTLLSSHLVGATTVAISAQQTSPLEH